jgi:dolichyl-phosphate mannosyltransferase polypeptide 3
MGLLRYQVFIAYGAVFLAIWYKALSFRNEAKADLSKEVDLLITFAPVWAVLGLGIYAVSNLIHGVSNMSDCPNAAKEIEKNVKEARKDMKKRGIQ